MNDSLGLGRFQYCLNVKDLDASEAFYKTLGFQQVSGVKAEGWLVLRKEDCELGLFKSGERKSLMNFRGGNVHEIVNTLSANGYAFKSANTDAASGSGSAVLEDPDGNVLFFDSLPEEIEDYKGQRPLLKSLQTIKVR